MLGLNYRGKRAVAPWLAALALAGCMQGDDASEGATGASASATDSSGGATAQSSASSDPGSVTDGATTATGSSSSTGPGDETEGSTTDVGTTGGGETDTDGLLDCFNGDQEGDACCLYDGSWPTAAAAETVKVVLTVKVNGEPLVASDSDDGYLFLIDTESDDRVLVGKTSFGPLAARVFPGTYWLVYESESCGPRLPCNRSAVLGTYEVGGAEATIAVDIPVVTAKTQIRVDTNVPPKSANDDGDVFLVDPFTRSRTWAARTSLLDADGAFTLNLVPGDYEVRYVAHASQGMMPVNVDASLGALAVKEVKEPGDAPAIVETDPIVMSTLVLDGDIFFNKEPAPPSALDHGRLYLRDGATDAITLIADTSFGRVEQVRVLDAPGTSYDLVYALVAHQSDAPVNEWATVRKAMSASALQAEVATLTLSTVDLSGSVSIDGMSPIHDQSNSGHLLLGMGGDRARIGGTTGDLAGVVLASQYVPYFRHEFSDGGLPVNTRGRVQEELVDLEKSPVLDLKIATATIGGAITIGGQPPPSSVYDTGRIFLRSADGDAVHLGLTREQSYTRRIIQGTYDVVYAVESSQGGVPMNHEVVFDTIAVTGDDPARDLDVPLAAAKIPNPMRAGGGTDTGSGRVYLRRVGSNDEIYVGASVDQEFEVRVVPGNYELVYRVDIVGDAVAANDGAVRGCYHIE